jgi:hypothetical protein
LLLNPELLSAEHEQIEREDALPWNENSKAFSFYLSFLFVLFFFSIL